MKKIDKIISLYFGSPPPHPMEYQPSLIDVLFNWTEEKTNKEHKRRLKMFKKDSKEYYKNRKKELKELKKLTENK